MDVNIDKYRYILTNRNIYAICNRFKVFVLNLSELTYMLFCTLLTQQDMGVIINKLKFNLNAQR